VLKITENANEEGQKHFSNFKESLINI